MKQIVLAITGGSGAAYARRLAQCLVRGDVRLHVVVSRYGARILSDELHIERVSIESLVGHSADNVVLYACDDLAARIASGSFITDGMVVCPCSGNTLAAVAGGSANNLITRAALVTLKETRRLVLVHREMPLSQIDIANMLRVSQAGGIICPACPGFYALPASVDDLVDFVVARVLDLLQVPHELGTRWNPQPPDPGQE